MCFTVAIQKNAKKVDLHYFGGEVPRRKKKTSEDDWLIPSLISNTVFNIRYIRGKGLYAIKSLPKSSLRS